MPIDGSTSMERLTSTDDLHLPADVSPDGSLLVFTEVNPDTGRDIWLRPLDSEGEPRPFLRTSYHEDGASVSSNGRLLAYVSDETGRREVYVERFPEGGTKVLISAGGARDPVWSPDGRELFYQWNNTMYAAEIVSVEPFTVGRVERLFEFALSSLAHGRAGYDVARDGRFLTSVASGAASGIRELRVVTDWFQVLEDKIGGAQD